MLEFLKAALEAVNFPYTGLMGLVGIYWVSVIIGALDFSFLDVEVDTEVGLDVDAGSGLSLGKALNFFNIGEIPFMILFSFQAFFMWLASINANYLLENTSGWVALGLSAPIFLGSLFLTKLATWPLKKLFRQLGKEEDMEVLGKVCNILLPAAPKKTGQAEILVEGAPMRFNIRTTDGAVLAKGQKALVIDFVEDKNYYIVEPYD